MTYSIWDKQSPIYDVTAEQAKLNNPLFATENSYLFYREDGSIIDCMPISMIPNPDNLTDEDEICKAYIKKVTTVPKSDVEILQTEVKSMTAQISALETQNSTLEECIVEMAGVVYA